MISQKILLCEPYLSGREWKYVKECLDSGWIATSGSFLGRFEKEVAQCVGSAHAVGVATGTAALHLALLAAGVQPEEEVLVPTITFIAPVNAIRYAGAHPVLMDVDPLNWQLDVGKVERFLREACSFHDGIVTNKNTHRRVKAILAVHLLGLCCPMDRLVPLAKEFQLKLIEDAAEGLGVRYRGRHVGTFGDIGTLSFNGNKLVSAGSGGMVLTQKRDLAERVRYLATQAKDNPDEFFHGAVGFNYRLTNLHAAVGLAQMEELEERISKKRRIAAFYEKRLGEIPGVSLMPQIAHCEPTYWLYTILLAKGERRKEVLKALHAAGIMARPLFHPIHGLPPYQGTQTFCIEHAESIYARAVCLPSSLGLDQAALEAVVACLEKALIPCRY
ncbi:MAG: LegC family aminotransferase [Deltaproteobacteria bacterium]|nr:LegC family aminotransferase [Deltaproteobacteria bacterium]